LGISSLVLFIADMEVNRLTQLNTSLQSQNVVLKRDLSSFQLLLKRVTVNSFVQQSRQKFRLRRMQNTIGRLLTDIQLDHVKREATALISNQDPDAREVTSFLRPALSHCGSSIMLSYHSLNQKSKLVLNFNVSHAKP
jgi:hypothetical protein